MFPEELNASQEAQVEFMTPNRTYYSNASYSRLIPQSHIKDGYRITYVLHLNEGIKRILTSPWL
jgi:hypothetical protein